jgi:hypothetical protein
MNYDDYYENPNPTPSGGSCYCKTMVLCSYCAKGYN